MKKSSTAAILPLPAFPWSSQEAFGSMRTALARERRRPLAYDELGTLMGVSKTTAYRWVEELENPTLIGFFACLERLPAYVRRDFIESRCRIFADFSHPALAHSPAQIGKLMELLQKKRGLSILVASDEFARGLVFNALGHTLRRVVSSRGGITGLDLTRPDRLVPLDFCSYVDEAGLNEIRKRILRRWPQIVTTSATTVMLNGAWLMADLRADILRLANRTHVLLGCTGTPDLRLIKQHVAAPIHVISVLDSKRVRDGIRVISRQLRSAKC